MVTNLDFNNTKENLLSIVFPFYNEEKTILKALKRLNDLNLDNFDQNKYQTVYSNHYLVNQLRDALLQNSDFQASINHCPSFRTSSI